MTLLQIVLVALAGIMVFREVAKLVLLSGVGMGVRFRLGYWLHLAATVALVMAAVVSFTGVQP